jgi:hypothetical protein
MLRFVPVVIVGTLCASAAFGAGAIIDMPAIVEFGFVTCLALFFAAVLAGTTNAPFSEGGLRQWKPTMILTRDHWPRVAVRSSTQFARKVSAALKSLSRPRSEE